MSIQVQNTGEAKGCICFLEYDLRPQASDWVFCYLWPLGVTTGNKAHPCLKLRLTTLRSGQCREGLAESIQSHVNTTNEDAGQQDGICVARGECHSCRNLCGLKIINCQV